MRWIEELMRKIVYSVAMSLDGYVAGPNGEADWIVMDPEVDFAESMARFDTVLMGQRTFEAAQAMGGGAAMPGVSTFLVSRTLRQEDHPGLTIISEDVGGAVSRLRAEPGKEIWLFGGGSLFRSLLDLGLVDMVEVAVIPVLLGSGIPLLPAGSQRTTLRLVNSKVYQTTGTVGLEYAVQQKSIARGVVP
jgi:dihydrofolate reductase